MAVGFSIGSDGLQLYISGSHAKGMENSTDGHYLETRVNADHTATLQSGADAKLVGATVDADNIKADVGGNLEVTSQQDEEHYKKRNQSLGGRLGIGIGAGTPISVGANFSNLKADSDYVAVQEQSGLFAGDNGYDVNVGHNTSLKGGAIVSTATEDKNHFSTDTLDYSNIGNHAKYKIKAESGGFSTSVAGNLEQAAQQGLSGGFGNDKGEAHNTTYAAISNGEIDVRSNPDQDLSGLKHSREEANQVLKRIFNKSKIKDVQEQAEVTQLFAQDAYQAVGDYYADLENAQAHLKQAQDTNQPADVIEKLQDLVADEQSKVLIPKSTAHALVGGITAVLGGANFVQGAMAAGLNEEAAEQLSDELPHNKALKNALATIVGASVGGTAGALTSADADMYNRQLHPTEIQWIKDNAQDFADKEHISEKEAEQRLTQQALKNIDRNWKELLGGEADEDALAYLSDIEDTFTNEIDDQQKLFTAVGNQANRPELYADTASDNLDFYQQNAVPGTTNNQYDVLEERGEANVKNAVLLEAWIQTRDPEIGNYLFHDVLSGLKGCVSGIGDCVKSIPGELQRQYLGIKDGTPVALSADARKKFNDIYGQDVSYLIDSQFAGRAAETAVGVVGGAGAAKTIGKTVVNAAGTAAKDTAVAAVKDGIETSASESAQVSKGHLSVTGDEIGDAADVSKAASNESNLAEGTAKDAATSTEKEDLPLSDDTDNIAEELPNASSGKSGSISDSRDVSGDSEPVAAQESRVDSPDRGSVTKGRLRSADNIANGPKLAKQLRFESANSPFTKSGALTDDAINNSREIIPASSINNSEIPKGFSKYSTGTFQSPAGNFQIHFYKNPKTGEVFYGKDYKAKFNSKSGG